MITDGLILALLVSLGLTILGYKMKKLPILFISSLGWLIAALQIYQQTAEFLPTVLLMMFSFAQFFLISNKD